MELAPSFTLDFLELGMGKVLHSWHPLGTCLAVAGSNRIVHIFDNAGVLLHRVNLATRVDSKGARLVLSLEKSLPRKTNVRR